MLDPVNPFERMPRPVIGSFSEVFIIFLACLNTKILEEVRVIFPRTTFVLNEKYMVHELTQDNDYDRRKRRK